MSRLSDIKRAARKAMHKGMSVEAVYTPHLGAPLADPLPVRLHNRRRVEGGMGPNGFTELLVTEDRAVFNQDTLNTLGVTLKAGDTIYVQEDGVTYRLLDRDLSDGPLNVYWRLNRI